MILYHTVHNVTCLMIKITIYLCKPAQCAVMLCIFSRGVVRGVVGIYIYLAFWPYGVHIMDIWSSGRTDIWSSEHLVIQSSCHHSRLLAIHTFDHLAIWTSGHPYIWLSAHLVFWPSVPECPDWEIFSLP